MPLLSEQSRRKRNLVIITGFLLILGLASAFDLGVRAPEIPVASNFIGRSIEGWFKPQVERPLDQALAVAQAYYRNLETTALRQAHHIARMVERDGLLANDRRDALIAYLTDRQDQMGLSAITVV